MRYCLAFLLVLTLIQSTAQSDNAEQRKALGIVTGVLVDGQNSKPVAFATLALINRTDSLKKYQQVSDKNGSFEFLKLEMGYYKLRIQALGFATLEMDSIYLRAERYDFNLGDIKLNTASNQLMDVVVYSEKPLIENKDGKITYNVGESALNSSASTAEILKNMPLINNDPNGKILLKGKEPKILIDDKPTELTAQQLQDLLESMPGSSIEKVEIMTNPPPQYATETGGVINIVTKKGKIGWIGRVNLTAGTRGEANLGLNLSYRNQKISFTNTVNVGASRFMGSSYSRRENIYKDSTNRFHTDGSFNNQNIRPNWRTQLEYEISKRQNLSFTYNGNLNFFDNNSRTQFTNINRFGETWKVSNRENSSNGLGYGHGLNLTYTLRGKKAGEVLRIMALANAGKNENDRDFFQEFLNGNLLPTGIDSTQSQFFNNISNSWSGRVNYDRPFQKQGNSFSTGLTYTKSNFHNTLNTNFLRKVDGAMVPNDALSNDFWFHQQVFTVRAGLNFKLPKEWRINFGAQAELTDMYFDILKGNATNTANKYWNVLPNATIRKEFNKSMNTALVYRATIRRPGIGELNPNIDYSDPYNIRFGNPYLQPSLADNIDWNFSLIKGKYYINTSLGYNRIKNVFNTIRNLIGGGVTTITWLNIADRQEYEASAWGGYTFSKQFRMNMSVGYTFNQYDEAEKKLYRYRDGGTFYTTLNYNYTPSSVLTFEGNARFSSFADPQGRSRSNLSTNLGVQHKFMDRRLIVSLNLIDPFTPQRFLTYTYGANFNIESFSSTNTRNIRLSIAYQLNRMVQKSSLNDKQKKAILDKIKK